MPAAQRCAETAKAREKAGPEDRSPGRTQSGNPQTAKAGLGRLVTPGAARDDGAVDATGAAAGKPAARQASEEGKPGGAREMPSAARTEARPARRRADVSGSDPAGGNPSPAPESEAGKLAASEWSGVGQRSAARTDDSARGAGGAPRVLRRLEERMLWHELREVTPGHRGDADLAACILRHGADAGRARSEVSRWWGEEPADVATVEGHEAPAPRGYPEREGRSVRRRRARRAVWATGDAAPRRLAPLRKEAPAQRCRPAAPTRRAPPTDRCEAEGASKPGGGPIPAKRAGCGPTEATLARLRSTGPSEAPGRAAAPEAPSQPAPRSGTCGQWTCGASGAGLCCTWPSCRPDISNWRPWNGTTRRTSRSRCVAHSGTPWWIATGGRHEQSFSALLARLAVTGLFRL